MHTRKRGIVVKRHGWLVILTVLVWVLIGLMINFVDPENMKDLGIKGSYVLPGLLVYIGLFLFLNILTLSSKRALLWSSTLLIFINLRIWGLGNYLNLLLLLGLAGSVEIYTSLSNKSAEKNAVVKEEN
jgi:hypothetical protein